MNIIVNSTFNPLTLGDLLAPVEKYNESYDKAEAEFADLVTQTEAWKDIANRENSPEAYAMYNNYASQLNAIVDDFSQGMTGRNRRQLLGLKRRYASEITPIAKASEAMQKANDFRDAAGNDAIFEVGRYNSLDDFLHGKTANNKFESRKEITARTAAIAQAAAQSILNHPEIRNSMSPQFLEIIQKQGLGSIDELNALIAGNPAVSNKFAEIKNQMIDALGGLDRFDANGKKAIEGAIHEGLYAGVNNFSVQLQQNGEYINAANRAEIALKQAGLALEEKKLNIDTALRNKQFALSQAEFGMKWAEHKQNMATKNLAIAQAQGKVPVTTLPDGRKIYQSGGYQWMQKQDGKGNYLYQDEEGNQFHDKKAERTDLKGNGKKLTPIYDIAAINSSSSSSGTSASGGGQNTTKKSKKLGRPLVFTNIRYDKDQKKAFADEAYQSYPDNDLNIVKRAVSPKDFTKEQIAWFTDFQDKFPDVDPNNLNFYTFTDSKGKKYFSIEDSK